MVNGNPKLLRTKDVFDITESLKDRMDNIEDELRGIIERLGILDYLVSLLVEEKNSE